MTGLHNDTGSENLNEDNLESIASQSQSLKNWPQGAQKAYLGEIELNQSKLDSHKLKSKH